MALPQKLGHFYLSARDPASLDGPAIHYLSRFVKLQDRSSQTLRLQDSCAVAAKEDSDLDTSESFTPGRSYMNLSFRIVRYKYSALFFNVLSAYSRYK